MNKRGYYFVVCVGVGFAAFVILRSGLRDQSAFGGRQGLPPAVSEPAGVDAGKPPAVVERQFAMDYGDARIPLAQREAALAELGRRGDTAAVAELIATAERGIYLSARALEELGRIRSPEVAAYLRQRVADGTSLRVRELAAAAVSLIRVDGDAALPDIERLLIATRGREDGLHEDVQEPVIFALSLFRGPEAARILANELSAFADQEGHDLYAGARLVAALAETREPSAAAVITAYADVLAERTPQALARQRAQFPREWDATRVDEGLAIIRRSYDAHVTSARLAAARLAAR